MTPDPTDRPSSLHQRPAGVDSDTVEAVGKLTEALETVVRARGHLFTFHQLTGAADFELEEAVDLLRNAGHRDLADRIDAELIGRNVLPGRWTFQILEEYDDGYYRTFKDFERLAREDLVGGRRHLHEAELKEERRTRGLPGHAARPGSEAR